jgi:hypothetical protein
MKSQKGKTDTIDLNGTYFPVLDLFLDPLIFHPVFYGNDLALFCLDLPC